MPGNTRYLIYEGEFNTRVEARTDDDYREVRGHGLFDLYIQNHGCDVVYDYKKDIYCIYPSTNKMHRIYFGQRQEVNDYKDYMVTNISCVDYYYCTNCTNCKLCQHCDECSECNYSEKCANCTYLEKSNNCNNCHDCKYCDYCVKSNHCTCCRKCDNCNYCVNSINCKTCSECYNCKDNEHCNDERHSPIKLFA